MEAQARFDKISIALHWSIAIAIIVVAATELLRGEVLPRGSLLREMLKALHDPAGTVVFALVMVRLAWRSFHPAPPLPSSMRSWEAMAAKSTHYLLYGLMVALPLSGIIYTLARGRPIDFGWFQIVYPLDHLVGRSSARAVKELHEFLGHAVLLLASAHAAAALWHHYVRNDDVLTRMLPRRLRLPGA